MADAVSVLQTLGGRKIAVAFLTSADLFDLYSIGERGVVE